MQLGRVFISSVFKEMLDLRASVAEAVRLVGMEPLLTENQVAQARDVESSLSREISQCDTYVGIFDRLRGTVPAGSDADRALEILRTSRDAFRLLRWSAKADEVDVLIRKIEQPDPPSTDVTAR